MKNLTNKTAEKIQKKHTKEEIKEWQCQDCYKFWNTSYESCASCDWNREEMEKEIEGLKYQTNTRGSIQKK